MKGFFPAAIAAILLTGAVNAAEVPEGFEKKLSEFIGPDYPISAIAETEFPEVFEVTAGTRVLYVAIKGDNLLLGNVFDMERRVNVGEEKQAEITRKIAEEEISQVPLESMVIFKGEETKRHITVFTDVECGYCRRLHTEVPELNEAGIEIRYLMYPVISERSYPNAVSVWCAEDQQTALTQAKLGQPIEEITCDSPVDAQLELGRKLGVNGTPFLVLDDYTLIPGYVPAKELIAQMGLQ
jgi:thiol:disulfide interchange protein DsbC